MMLTKIRTFVKTSAPQFLDHPLWEGRRIYPFLRFAKLQLLFALGKNKVHIKWINGLILPIKKGDAGLTGNYYLGLHEFADMAFAIHVLREDDSFIDIGSNLGTYSLLASGVAKANSVAIEAVPSTHERLVENIGVNLLGHKIKPKCIALSTPLNRSNGVKLRFSSDRGCMNSFVDDSYRGSTISVATSTLDEECMNINPVLIKIDVEGFEEDVLKGASETLRKPSLLAVIIEGQTENVNQLFRAAGFIDVSYSPFERKIEPRSKYTPNRIWIKGDKVEAVKTLLRTAPIQTAYGNKF